MYSDVCVCGFVWARWGAGAWMHSKTGQADTKMGNWDMISSPMVGEISPNMMFGKNGHTGAPVGADGCAWVCMGALGCRGTGGQENKVAVGEMNKQGAFHNVWHRTKKQKVTCTNNKKHTHKTGCVCRSMYGVDGRSGTTGCGGTREVGAGVPIGARMTHICTHVTGGGAGK